MPDAAKLFSNVPNDEQWQQMSDAERIAAVQSGKISIKHFEQALQSDNAELRSPAKAKNDEYTRKAWDAVSTIYGNPFRALAELRQTLYEQHREAFDKFSELLEVNLNLWRDIFKHLAELDPRLKVSDEDFAQGEISLETLEDLLKNSPEISALVEKAIADAPEGSSLFLVIRDALRDEADLRKRKSKADKLNSLELTRHQPLSLAEHIRFSCTNLNKIYVEGLMPDAMKDFALVQESLEGLKNKTLVEALEFKVAYIGRSKKDLEGVVGFNNKLSQEFRDLLENENALLTKAHYILSERFYVHWAE